MNQQNCFGQSSPSSFAAPCIERDDERCAFGNNGPCDGSLVGFNFAKSNAQGNFNWMAGAGGSGSLMETQQLNLPPSVGTINNSMNTMAPQQMMNPQEQFNITNNLQDSNRTAAEAGNNFLKSILLRQWIKHSLQFIGDKDGSRAALSSDYLESSIKVAISLADQVILAEELGSFGISEKFDVLYTGSCVDWAKYTMVQLKDNVNQKLPAAQSQAVASFVPGHHTNDTTVVNDNVNEQDLNNQLEDFLERFSANGLAAPKQSYTNQSGSSASSTCTFDWASGAMVGNGSCNNLDEKITLSESDADFYKKLEACLDQSDVNESERLGAATHTNSVGRISQPESDADSNRSLEAFFRQFGPGESGKKEEGASCTIADSCNARTASAAGYVAHVDDQLKAYYLQHFWGAEEAKTSNTDQLGLPLTSINDQVMAQTSFAEQSDYCDVVSAEIPSHCTKMKTALVKNYEEYFTSHCCSMSCLPVENRLLLICVLLLLSTAPLALCRH
jgi:hypothetical protein